jgi:hypothetical protein
MKVWVTDGAGKSVYGITDDNKVMSTETGEEIGNFTDNRIIRFDGTDLGGLEEEGAAIWSRISIGSIHR